MGIIVTASVVTLALLGFGGWTAWRTLAPVPSPTPSPPTTTSSTTEPTVIRTSSAPLPTTNDPVTGGQIGQTIELVSARGRGTIRVDSARWTNGGFIKPEPGMSYLVVQLTYAGTSGTLPTGLLYARVTGQDGIGHSFTIGPDLTNRLPIKFLSPGETSSGEIAFELARGPVTFEALDESLRPVATVAIP